MVFAEAFLENQGAAFFAKVGMTPFSTINLTAAGHAVL